MMQGLYTITENRPLTTRVSRLRLRGNSSAATAPGQFVDVLLPGCFLRRPFSICDAQGGDLTLLYERVGKGTELLRELPNGSELDVLTGLGNGFDLSESGDTPLLIGGGTGVSPLYALAKALVAAGKKPSVILGFATRADVLCEEEFCALGVPVTVCTADGSYGVKGFATDAMGGSYSYFYACGPRSMLHAVCERSTTSGQLSFDAHMGCGFGACRGCGMPTIAGNKRVCKDGPVFRKEEILWDD